ncbi:MAG: class I SAM-dependent methyltransferase [Candidatus Diapherotrites archaeon]|nr:class I SAM-dependent methyltransferase [Candidatus Diapherotrites archaeon]
MPAHERENLDEDIRFRSLMHYAPIIQEISHYIQAPKGKTFLHLGDSAGILTYYLQTRGAKAISLDTNPLHSKIARETGNRKVIRGNAKSLPFRENSLDCVISGHFLFAEYPVLDDRETNQGSLQILNEVRRALKPGGIAIVFSAAINPDKPEYRPLIEQNGFTITRIKEDPDGAFHRTLFVLRKK